MEALFRIDGKHNVFLNEQKATSFRLYRRRGRLFLFAGEYCAPGWDCSDARCVQHAEDTAAAAEDKQ